MTKKFDEFIYPVTVEEIDDKDKNLPWLGVCVAMEPKRQYLDATLISFG
jgi:hypothetical protein